MEENDGLGIEKDGPIAEEGTRILAPTKEDEEKHELCLPKTPGKNCDQTETIEAENTPTEKRMTSADTKGNDIHASSTSRPATLDARAGTTERTSATEAAGEPANGVWLMRLIENFLEAIQPLPLASGVRSVSASQPGAFAVQGFAGGPNPFRSITTSHDNASHRESNSDPVVDVDNDLELAEAEPVPDEALPRAQEMSSPSGAQATAKSKKAMAALSVVLALIVAVLLAVTIKGRQGATHTPSKTTSTDTGVQAPAISDFLKNEERVLKLLPNETVLALRGGSNTTAQSFALRWLLDDPFFLNYSDARIIQRFALATLFYASKGPQWYSNEHWTTYGTHECDWWSQCTSGWPYVEEPGACFGYPYGNVSLALPYDTLGRTEQSDVYTRLWLHENNLEGDTLPPEIYLLTSLISLQLQANLFPGGTISSHIGRLKNLRDLFLYSNDLKGSIPTEIGLLTSMDHLSLLNNKLTGSVPSEIGLLTNLKFLFLDTNQLTGSLPSDLFMLSRLEYLYLYGNTLTGTLPSSLGMLSQSLLQLSLDGNLFTGSLPSEIGKLWNATALNFAGNNFSGLVPSELIGLRTLERLYLSSNTFSGTLPKQLGLLGTTLLVVDITDNPALTGTIPGGLCHVGENQTCPWIEYFECTLSFDCTDKICGCDCNCEE